MTNVNHTQNKAINLTVEGRAIKIKSRSTWIVSEGADYTQVCLDQPGHELDGMTIAMDWSQGSVRPAYKVERIKAILEDADILADHAANHIAA